MSNLGTPVKADVDTIEKELTALWKSAAESGSPRNELRACACNLVSIVENREEAEAFLPVAAKVSEWHPSRSVIAFPETDSIENRTSDEMQAWVNTQCSTPFSGAPEVCCEVIVIAAPPKAIAELPNMLSAVLIADLPVYVYWKSLNAEDQELPASGKDVSSTPPP